MLIKDDRAFAVLLMFLVLGACCIPGSATPPKRYKRDAEKPSPSSSSLVSTSESSLGSTSESSLVESSLGESTSEKENDLDKAIKRLEKALHKYFESGGSSFCIHGECQADEDDYVCTCEPGYTGNYCETAVVAIEHAATQENREDASESSLDKSTSKIENALDKARKGLDKARKGLDKARKGLGKALSKYFQSGGSSFCIHGECQADEDDYVCTCEPGYTGKKCETDIDECASSPCKNEATCVDKINEFNCECAPGWEGTLCETNECACLKEAVYIDNGNGYDCACASSQYPIVNQDESVSIQSLAAPGKYLSFDPARGDDAVKFVDANAQIRLILPANPCKSAAPNLRYQVISNAGVLEANVWVMQWNGTAGSRIGLATCDDINVDSYTFEWNLDRNTGIITYESPSLPNHFVTYKNDGLYVLEKTSGSDENTRSFRIIF